MTIEPDVEEPDRRPGAPHPRETSVLFGQGPAERGFLDALAAGRLSHGWLITGPEGVGKATLAWRIARHLLAGGQGDSLEMAPSERVFRQVAQLSAPQLLLCRRPWDDKTKRLRTAITVDEIRALKSFFQMSAPDGGWRVAIVDAADDLTVSSANALLKILEEPPERAALLLVSNQPTRLLPTIRSRCRQLRCLPLAPEALAAALQAAGHPVSDAELPVLAVLSGGSPGAALDLAAAGGVALYDDILQLIRTAPPLDRRRLVALADACSGRDSGARFALTLDLLRLAVSRLALAAAGSAIDPVSEAEAALRERLGQHPEQAKIWAELEPDLLGRAERSRALNLDPGQVILDTFLRIDAAAERALLPAA